MKAQSDSEVNAPRNGAGRTKGCATSGAAKLLRNTLLMAASLVFVVSSAHCKICSYNIDIPGEGRINFTMGIDDRAYEEYVNRPRTGGWGSYVETGVFDDEIIWLCDYYLKRVMEEYELSRLQMVDAVISFVQNLPYTSDKASSGYDEYPRYPVETLFDGGGDCEDTSILLACMLIRLNTPCVCVVFPGHMLVGVDVEALDVDEFTGDYVRHSGKSWAYCETTSGGWRTGVLPQEFSDEEPRVYVFRAERLEELNREIEHRMRYDRRNAADVLWDAIWLDADQANDIMHCRMLIEIYEEKLATRGTHGDPRIISNYFNAERYIEHLKTALRLMVELDPDGYEGDNARRKLQLLERQ